MTITVPFQNLSISPSPPQPFDASKFDLKSTAKKMVRWSFNVCGILPRYPLDTVTVLKLVEMCGYRCNNDKLKYLFRCESLTTPEKNGKGYSWYEANIVELITNPDVK